MSCTRRKFLTSVKISHAFRYPASTNDFKQIDRDKLMTIWRQCILTNNIPMLSYIHFRYQDTRFDNKFDLMDFIGYFLELIYESNDNSLLDIILLSDLLRPGNFLMGDLLLFKPFQEIVISFNNRGKLKASINRIINACIRLNVNPFIVVFFNLPKSLPFIVDVVGYDLFLEYNPIDELADLILANRLSDSEKNPLGVYELVNPLSYQKRRQIAHYVSMIFHPLILLDPIDWDKHPTLKKPLNNAVNQAINKLLDSLVGQHIISSTNNIPGSPSRIWSPIQRSSNFDPNMINIINNYMDIFQQIELKLLPTDKKQLSAMARAYFEDQKINVDEILRWSSVMKNSIYQHFVEIKLGFFDYTLRENFETLLVDMEKEYTSKTQEEKEQYTVLLYERLIYLILLYEPDLIDVTELYPPRCTGTLAGILLDVFKMGVMTKDRPSSYKSKFERYGSSESESETFARNVFISTMTKYYGTGWLYLIFSNTDVDINTQNNLLPIYTIGDYKSLNIYLLSIYRSNSNALFRRFMEQFISIEMLMQSEYTADHLIMIESIRTLSNKILQ